MTSPGAPPPGRPGTAVVVVAAGSGSRLGADTNKVLLPLHGVPVLGWTLRTVAALPHVSQLVLVIRPRDHEQVARIVGEQLPEDRTAVVVPGGPARHDSEWAGLRTLLEPVEAGLVDVIVVHDAARPLADAALFDTVVETARAHGGAVPARPQPGLLGDDGRRRVAGLVGVQTPQAFRAAPLLEAYAAATADGFGGTDTASCFATYTPLPVMAVASPATNLKVTFAEDLALAERLLSPDRP